MVKIKKCLECGAEFYGWDEHDYCPACAKNKNLREVRRIHACKDCGVEFYGGSTAMRCPECARKARQESSRKWHETGSHRRIGSLDKCKICGKEYIVKSGRQKYCPECICKTDDKKKKPLKMIEGETYGKITILEKVYRKEYLEYLCRCNLCGSEFVTRCKRFHDSAENGCPKCREKKRLQQREENYRGYIGRIYGNLAVIEYVGEKIVKGKGSEKYPIPVMMCKCQKCGTNVEIPLDRLKCGGAKQCATCARENLKKGHDFIDKVRVDGTLPVAIDGRRKKNKNSTTGHTGVSYMPGCGMYRAYINFRRKQYSLGVYVKIEDAVAARKAAEEKIYGDFLKWYAETYPEKWELVQNSR